MSLNEIVFHEVYGSVPRYLLRAFQSKNVSQSDWDSMLARWGYSWDSPDLPFAEIHNHIVTHSANGYYQYPMYG